MLTNKHNPGALLYYYYLFTSLQESRTLPPSAKAEMLSCLISNIVNNAQSYPRATEIGRGVGGDTPSIEPLQNHHEQHLGGVTRLPESAMYGEQLLTHFACLHVVTVVTSIDVQQYIA
jgi:hypothetical protein